MKALNQVQRDRAPLHQQLLILIPMIKALEDWREKQPMSLPPLTVDIQYHRGGALTLELNKTQIENDGRIVPDLTLHDQSLPEAVRARTYLHYCVVVSVAEPSDELPRIRSLVQSLLPVLACAYVRIQREHQGTGSGMKISYCSESIHAQIFDRLLDVIPDLHTIDDVGLSEVKGMLPLHFDVVSRSPTKLIIMLGHSRAADGGVVINSEMTAAVYLDRSVAEALTYRDEYMTNSVYSPDRSHIDILAKRVLNDYLYAWLGKLIAAGHAIRAIEDGRHFQAH